MEFNIDVQKQDYNRDYNQTHLSAGWYKFIFKGLSEPKLSKSGDVEGALFDFEEDGGGLVRAWFATRVINARAGFQLKKTEAFFGRLAQIFGLRYLRDFDELLNRPFYGCVDVTSYDKTISETLENGEIRDEVKKIYTNNFGSVPSKHLLSVAEYRAQFAPPQQVDGGEQPTRRVVRKASEQPTAIGIDGEEYYDNADQQSR